MRVFSPVRPASFYPTEFGGAMDLQQALVPSGHASGVSHFRRIPRNRRRDAIAICGAAVSPALRVLPPNQRDRCASPLFSCNRLRVKTPAGRRSDKKT